MVLDMNNMTDDHWIMHDSKHDSKIEKDFFFICIKKHYFKGTTVSTIATRIAKKWYALAVQCFL